MYKFIGAVLLFSLLPLSRGDLAAVSITKQKVADKIFVVGEIKNVGNVDFSGNRVVKILMKKNQRFTDRWEVVSTSNVTVVKAGETVSVKIPVPDGETQATRYRLAINAGDINVTNDILTVKASDL